MCWRLDFFIVLWGLWLVLRVAQPHVACAQELKVRDTNFRQEGTEIVVTYDLLGENGEDYTAKLLLSTSGGRAFDYEPKAITGDVGEGIRPGLDKRIAWAVLEDFPDGLRSQNVQMKVVVKKEGGNGWLYTIGGAVLVGGGGTLAAFLTGLIGGDSGSDGSDSGGSSPTPIPPPDGPP